MVMETPSPQCVGREFVRQYYTLLNEAPLHLHRFYSHNSSFVHGGVEKPGEEQPPVTGQAEIHKKIMSLNFRDCHAKIRQVDSQATVGNAVVVQVTGELSNSGQPMRRFMQTFVLAPQSPKKYYVHNDIFRYQDEVFHDNDSDMENLEEGIVDDVDSDMDPVDVGQDTVQDQGVQQYYETHPQMSNGTHLDDRGDTPSPQPEEDDDNKEEPVGSQTEEMFEMKEEEQLEAQPEEIEHEQPGQMSIQFMEQKPFSWAGIASKNANTGSVQVSAASPPFGKVPQSVAPRQDVKAEIGAPTPGSGPQPQRQARPPRENRPRERERVSVSRDDGDSDSQSGRQQRSRFPDNQQLFVGNLPHNITEKELKDFFEKYGPVVELRINTKSGGGKLPNFGFVVFDSPEPVQTILSSKPIKYNGEHRLNVEEKKPRGGAAGGGRGGPPRGGMGAGRGGAGFGSGGRGGPRGSGSGGPGPGPRSERGSTGGRGGGMPGPRR